MVEFQKKMILKLRRKNKRLRNQRDRQRKLAAKRKGQEAKEESSYHAALVKDDINSGDVASNEQPISVPNFIENGKDKEMRAEKSLAILANLEREVDLNTHKFPEDVFQDPDNSGDTQQYWNWKQKFQEDTMSLDPQLNLMLMNAQAEEARRLDLSPMSDFPLLMDEDLFDGRLDYTLFLNILRQMSKL